MKRNLIAAAVAATLATAMSFTGAQQGKISDDVVKIGVLTDMSGLYADYGGPGAVAAAKMAVEDFGGKVFGKNIEVVNADHQNKPDIAKNVTQQWFDRDKVDMTVENLNSAVALTIQALGKEKNKITIVTGAATARLTNEDCAPATGIHYLMDTIALGNVVGKAVVKDGGKSWYFLTADYAFGHSLEKDTGEVVKASGGKVLGAVRHPLSTGDFSSFLLQAQSSGADVVGLANAGGDTVNSVKAAAEFGLTKKQSLAALLMLLTDVHAIGLNTAQGLYLTEGWYWDLNDEARAWTKRYEAIMKKSRTPTTRPCTRLPCITSTPSRRRGPMTRPLS
jgi:branched-chain amino acid transport system substrate-binding protein